MSDPLPGGVMLHEQILACVCTALADTANTTPVAGYGPVQADWCCWTMGTDPLPAQACCESATGNGMAWVRTVSFDPIATDVCGNAFALDQTLEVGVHRCAPKMVDEKPVPCDVRSLHAKRMEIDAWALRQAVLCCPGLESVSWQFRTLAPLATSGGCSSWAYQFAVRVEDACPIVFTNPGRTTP